MSPRLLRSIHTYSSLIAFFLLILFSLTGVMLNHPEVFEQEPESAVRQFSLEEGYDPVITFLKGQGAGRVSRGDLEGLSPGDIFEHKTPGMSVAVVLLPDRGVEVELTNYGVVGFITDLHKGRQASQSWLIFVDVISLFIVLMCLTGVYISLTSMLRKKQSMVILTLSLLLMSAFMVFA
ncbi:PepSY-associated TM helix domain-containing protein [uncultured Pseudoteredinibacter sp.]|uniref:PepSY-associated TM helix domain-containing protein n=1 Tax=uncultured Pseudoteredinibacter sp. TaxID=1641701 RepID=UPI002627BEEF|nr:PepSY-associated TM helix domain-containing protein [uncultured Pseudoteredinibacter sp.]